jgi:hypothetical protein
MENINNNTGNFVEMPHFVGYHMAEDGIGKARIKEFNETTVTLSICGDDGIWSEWQVISKEDFNRNWEYLKFVVAKAEVLKV